MRINDPHEDKALGRWIDKVQNLAEGRDNYASNGLVKTQLWASFHIRADTRRLCVDRLSWCLSTSGGGGGEGNLQRFIRGGNWWIHYGIEQLLYNVALWSFYLQFSSSWMSENRIRNRLSDYWRWFNLRQTTSCLETFYRGFHCFTVNKYC